MTREQEERLVAAWEGIAQGLGALNEIARTAISKQWPEAREPREAVISRIPTPEERLKKETGNTAGPIDEWLDEFNDEQGEIGPREKEFLEQKGDSSGTKAPSKTKG